MYIVVIKFLVYFGYLRSFKFILFPDSDPSPPYKLVKRKTPIAIYTAGPGKRNVMFTVHGNISILYNRGSTRPKTTSVMSLLSLL